MSVELGVIRCVDFFSGAGGLSLGAHQAGAKTLYAVELDRNSTLTFAQHSPDALVLNQDISTLDFQFLRGRVDVILGGPPCQPFSSGGLLAADEDERNMIPEFIRAVSVVRPLAFVMENVPGLTVGERRIYLEGVLQELEALGYTLSWQIVAAADYGVPQKRKRLIVVGTRKGRYQFPQPTHGPLAGRPYVTVNDVLPPHQVGEPNLSSVTYAKKPDLRPSPYDGLLFNGGGRLINREDLAPTIIASAGGNKTHFFDDVGVVKAYHAQLLTGGPIRAGTVEGVRRLTVLESALLQTFPADLQFQGPRSAHYRQIGNAVPPRLAEVIVRALIEQLNLSAPELIGAVS